MQAGLVWIDLYLLRLIFSFQARSAIQNRLKQVKSKMLNYICLCDTILMQTGLFKEKSESDIDI